MLQLLYTDLIKNRTVQWLILVMVFAELCLAKSIQHSLIFMGIPYVISLVMHHKFKAKKVKQTRRISYQYKTNKVGTK